MVHQMKCPKPVSRMNDYTYIIHILYIYFHLVFPLKNQYSDLKKKVWEETLSFTTSNDLMKFQIPFNH